MAEDPIKDMRQKELGHLREHINGYSKAVQECSMIMVRHHAQGIGEYMGILGHRANLKDEKHKKENHFLVDTYEMFSDTIRLCNCKKR